MKKKCSLTIVLALAIATLSSSVAANEIVVDTDTEGAVHDSILDGFPSLASYDGVGDFGGNALGVALQKGVTEERAIVEFPLEALGEVDAASIAEAILTVNVDDVVATFGPGTGFSGVASSDLEVHVFAGDGAITLADFARTSVEPLAVIDTTPFGDITDATLAASGPLVFDVDVTEALGELVDGGQPFFGIVIATKDNQTGTSIDDLGPSAAGPPGVGGARLPFLTVRMADPPTTTTTSTSTTSTSMEPDSFCGDANADGNLSAGDALFILRAAVSHSLCPLALCDADGNGNLTASDAMRVLKVAVGSTAVLICKN